MQWTINKSGICCEKPAASKTYQKIQDITSVNKIEKIEIVPDSMKMLFKKIEIIPGVFSR